MRETTENETKSCDVEIQAIDGFELGGRMWLPLKPIPPEYVAMINAGAGILSSYYDKFAAFLAGWGIPTLVYDYRGIGRSRPKSLKGFEASVEDWGAKDCAAALDWLSKTYPAAKRIVVGHSVGGFVTGFADNGALIDRMLLVSAHTGYWGDYAKKVRAPMFLLWHMFMPAVTRFIGYFPGRRLRLLEDLPEGVALEWGGRRKPEFWAHLRQADGTLDMGRVDSLLVRFANVRARTVAVRFTDDPFATIEATQRILSLFRNAVATQITIDPQDYEGMKIGHFGFFRSRFRGTLWPLVVRALLPRGP